MKHIYIYNTKLLKEKKRQEKLISKIHAKRRAKVDKWFKRTGMNIAKKGYSVFDLSSIGIVVALVGLNGLYLFGCFKAI